MVNYSRIRINDKADPRQMEATNFLYKVEDHSYHELMEEAQRLAHFGGWEVNILTGAVKWSSEMYSLLGYNPVITEATFKNFIKKLHREDILYVKRNLENLLKTPSPDTYDFRIIDQDGSIKYLRTGIVVKRDEFGKAISMTGFSHDITAQKLAEKKIEKVNRDLNTFFKVIDDVFFSVDITTHKLIQISEGCEKLYGYTIREIMADFGVWDSIYFPEDKDVIDSGNRQLAAGETIVSQYRIIRKNGAILWVESKIIPTLNRSGILIRLDGVTRDITDRKNAELEHQRTEKRYRQIVESAQEGIWTIDENDKTDFVNKKLCEILEYSAEEMLGKELFYFMDEKGRAYAEECMERRRKGARENLDFRYITKTGKHVWANITASPFLDENGKYKGALAMLTDITERRQSEFSLKKSEANLRTVFDHTDIGVVLFSANNKVASYNAQANEFFAEQYQKELAIDAPATSYFRKHKRKLFEKILSKVKNHEIVNYETNFYSKQNELKWYDIKWVGIYNEQKEFIGLLLTFKKHYREKGAGTGTGKNNRRFGSTE